MNKLPSLFRLPAHGDVPLSRIVGKVRADRYAFPWPDEMPGLGPRHVGSFDLCVKCGTGSWVRYGQVVLCLSCALGGSSDRLVASCKDTGCTKRPRGRDSGKFGETQHLVVFGKPFPWGKG